jgi:inner membrane protein
LQLVRWEGCIFSVAIVDSLSQLALGAAVGIAVMGRRTAVWKAALWGGVCGTLPDLDALVDFGDAVKNMTYHRAESHGLFYLTLVSPALAYAASRIHAQPELFKRWWLALWLALVTHPLLDVFTIYGTQILQPFSETPYGIGSMFIIDPAYTLPLLIGVITALSLRKQAGLNANLVGLVVSTLYLVCSVAIQAHVLNVAKESLAASGQTASKLFATPSPLNTILWRVVVMRENGYDEGFYSLFDRERKIRFDRFTSDDALYRGLRNEWAVARMAWFTDGFFKMEERDGKAILSDLRMGQEPNYVFAFALAQRQSPNFAAITPLAVGSRGDTAKGLAWIWTRLKGHDTPPPR